MGIVLRFFFDELPAAGDLLRDGWLLDNWLLPCCRCGATNYGNRIPELLCDQCMTAAEYENLDKLLDNL